MKVYTDQLFSSSTRSPQKPHHPHHQQQVNSQFHDSALEQSTTIKPSNEHFEQQSQKGSMNACSIVSIIVLAVMLVVSVGLNVYFGVKVNENKLGAVRVKVYQEEWYDNCKDQTYELTIENLSGKKVLLNVTHWPMCYYENNPIRTRLLQLHHIEAQNTQNQIQQQLPSTVTIGEPLPPSNQTIDPPQRNEIKPPQNKIFNNEHKVSVVAWVY